VSRCEGSDFGSGDEGRVHLHGGCLVLRLGLSRWRYNGGLVEWYMNSLGVDGVRATIELVLVYALLNEGFAGCVSCVLFLYCNSSEIYV
jgi:hypothetical protein